MKRAVLFTGPGGLRAVQSLEKLSQYCNRQGCRVSVVEFDDHLITKYLEQFPGAEDRDLLEGPGGLSYLLLKPKEYLRRLWRMAVTEKLQQVDEGVQCLFLSLHAVFYNNQSREFFSPVQVDHLEAELEKKGFGVEQVITLIDDVYDVLRHLARPNQLFAFSERADSYHKAVEAILSQHLALDWRSIETFHAAEIAGALGKPHVILAVKHPLDVAYGIAISNKPMAYVSHPISDVRLDGPFQEEVTDLAHSLRRSGFAVPVCPTSIDELLLETAEKGKVYRPRLVSRWPFGRPDSLLFVPPQNAEMNPVDPDGAFSERQNGFLAGLLYSLVEAMLSQLNARDRALVEQASLIVVWRPFYTGELSLGVQEEIGHRNRLVDHGLIRQGQKRCFVYGPPADLGRWRVTQLVAKLGKATAARDGASLPQPTLREIRTALCADPQLVNAFATGTVNAQATHDAVTAIAPGLQLPASSTTSTLSGTRSVVESHVRHQRWQALVTEVQAASPLDGLVREGDDYVQTQMTVDEVVAHIGDQWECPS